MRIFIVSISLVFLLSGCNFSSFAELIFFSRVKFTLMNDAGDKKYIYLCKKKDTEKATRDNAIAANKFLTAGLAKISQKYADDLMKGIEKDTDTDESMTTAESSLDDAAEKIIDELESKYQCLMIDSIDLEE